MGEDDEISAEDLSEALAAGIDRCKNDERLNAGLLVPQRPRWALDPKTFIEEQLKRFGSYHALLGYYVELLARADVFVEFMEQNCGDDEEWPMMVLGDSEASEVMFDTMRTQLRDAIGCLTEI